MLRFGEGGTQLLRSHKMTKILTPFPHCSHLFDFGNPLLSCERSKLYTNPPSTITTATTPLPKQ